MEEEKKDLEQEKRLSRTTLTFYIVALFSVAIALILISYVAQERADRQLENLSSELSEQQTAAKGAAEKMEALQQQMDELQKMIDAVCGTLDSEPGGLEAAAQSLLDEKEVYAALAQVSGRLLADDLQAAQQAFDQLVRDYGEERLGSPAAKDAFSPEINRLYETVKQSLAGKQAEQPEENE